MSSSFRLLRIKEKKMKINVEEESQKIMKLGQIDVDVRQVTKIHNEQTKKNSLEVFGFVLFICKYTLESLN
jgi:hypothetical protein